MKSKICLILLLLNLVVYSQDKTIYVEYKVTLADDGSFTKNKMFADDFLNAVKAADQLVFGLLINDKGSKFYQVDTGIENSFEIDAAKMYSKYMGVIYSLEDQVLKEKQFLGQDIYLKEKKVENWILTSETKQIDNYLCYKATNTYTVVNIKGTFKFPVIAWYCPKLPYSFGPLGYGNLPGLILELQVRNVNYHSKNIDLRTKLDFNTDFLKKATLLSEEELNKKIDEFNNFGGK
ncbi:GLPGLI family protein [Flavobacterium sp.]|jgi:GLPGLI family protein|uniref:GLPGLI family protein n=1 Tax=Flavobacterium sp. TaxID=239 RepID=UPI0022C3DF83|nr:GLPGLI family protein [Flavobacterium sp.]MCZ8089197.1 GLPGLI family protein [Flavobacterium sp.]